MVAQYNYTHATGSNVDISDRVRAYRNEVTANAEEGTVAISTMMIDDPDGGLDIKGLRGMSIHETSESSNSSLVYHGYTFGSDIDRGSGNNSSFRTATSRLWTVQLQDSNSLINRRIMRGADANRPAETDVQRVQWLMTTGEFGLLVTDSTWISTASPVAMDAVDYRNQRCQDILSDCSQASGKNFFIILNQIPFPATTALFYDFAHSTAYASTIRLTNDLADVDDPVTSSSTTFAVINERTKLNRDPSRVYAGIVLPFDGGEVFVYDAAIGTAFYPRDTLAPSVNVKTTAKATARANRYLADASTEADVLTTAFLVPLALVNRLREGHTFQAKFTHFPGYSGYAWWRCLKRTVIATSEEFYTVVVEASPAAGAAPSAIACATQVSSMTTWDSGALGNIGGSNCSALVIPAGTPPSYPTVVIGGIMAQNGQSQLTSGTVAISGAFTDLGDFPHGTGSSTVGAAGYKALSSGAPGNLGVAWSGADCAEVYRAIAINLQTAATAPVQTGEQIGSGQNITLGAAPTVGNILVLVRFAETSPFSSVPTGYTQMEEGQVISSAPGILTVDICVRCVQTGDTALQTLINNSFSHWQFLSEWALT